MSGCQTGAQMNIQHRLHRDWSERNSCEQDIKNFVR